MATMTTGKCGLVLYCGMSVNLSLCFRVAFVNKRIGSLYVGRCFLRG